MRKIALSLVVLSLVAIPSFAGKYNKVISVGDKAPDFTLLSNDWKEVKLSDFQGKKNVVVVFYVLAFTDT